MVSVAILICAVAGRQMAEPPEFDGTEQRRGGAPERLEAGRSDGVGDDLGACDEVSGLHKVAVHGVEEVAQAYGHIAVRQGEREVVSKRGTNLSLIHI